jgi:acetyltransferase-like isoleucine patch superfamily enzyme
MHRGLLEKIRYHYQKTRLGSCGKDVVFENNVKIIRYPKNVSVGNDVIIKEGVRICSCNSHAKIGIGNNTTIGYHTFIFSSERINIGADCLIAPFVYIVDSDHGIARDTNINQQPNVTAPIRIDDDVWIGAGATILKGVTVGRGAVIAAGSVVTEPVGQYQIVGGIPARGIGNRK